MTFILFILFIGASGPENVSYRFPTIEACEVARANIPKFIAKFNENEEDEIVAYASACTEMKLSGTGTGV
jgi:hypothetical protein